MINLETEKNLKITSQQTYDIIAKAIDLANDEGFINSFVFERALYITMLAAVNEEERDNIADAMENGDSPLVIWNTLLNNGKIESLIEEYSEEIDYISREAIIWYEDYVTYAASPRGMIDSLDALASSFSGNISQQVEALQGDNRINETLEIAEKWGMNNSLDNYSLFEE